MPRMLSGFIDSKPMTKPWQPLASMRSISSSSSVISIEACDTQRIFSGMSARINSLACSWLETRLSSMKKTSLRSCARISAMTSSIGRTTCLRSKKVLIAQKSQAKRQPRPNWTRPIGR